MKEWEENKRAIYQEAASLKAWIQGLLELNGLTERELFENSEHPTVMKIVEVLGVIHSACEQMEIEPPEILETGKVELTGDVSQVGAVHDSSNSIVDEALKKAQAFARRFR